jgi:flagellar hook-associated protein 1
MGVLNIGTQALQANLVALQTAGNNIANVNTAGYSRQKVIMQTVPGQFTGGGYIGKGVTVQTIQRNFSEFLTRQSTLASSTQAADVARTDKLKQLQGIFEGGANGLGASINDMLNSFSDVASAPSDLTARSVALTRVDETAARMRAASQRLDDLQVGVSQELSQKVDAINSLSQSIADVNDQISKVQGTGQPPNDLLDRRDQLIREMNNYVQTTSVAADDGTVGVFIGGSQSLVLGTQVSKVSLVKDDFGDTLKNKLSIDRNGTSITLNENTLGGGEVSGLIRFQNADLNEGRNLLGRLTLAITTSMNDQHKLGLDLDGNVGGNLFSPISFVQDVNIRKPVPPAVLNTGNATLNMAVGDTSKFVASDYQVLFSSATTGTITRSADGVQSTFDFGVTNPVKIDGLNLTIPVGTAATGDRYLLKPFSTSASNITSQFATPRALAVASPVAGSMGTTNTGSLQQISVTARSNPPTVSTTSTPVVLTFTSPTQFTRSDAPGTFNYVPGQPIEGTVPATSPLSEWSVVLQGSPKAGDTFTVKANPYTSLSAGNATALMNVRDIKMFDGAATTDGYAALISKIGIRTQSANYAAEVSTSIAINLERDRAGVSGVNLDEEAAKLLQFQQAYQASAKMIQISTNIFETLLQGLSR